MLASASMRRCVTAHQNECGFRHALYPGSQRVSGGTAFQPSQRLQGLRVCRRVAMQHAALGENVHVASMQQDQRSTPAESEEQAGERFKWAKQWYPVAVAADLDPGRPNSVTLLGRPLCLWRDGEGEWRAFEDRCPHRLAPLTEGRLEEDGTINCSYHGWRFNGEGKCTSIPQAEEKAEATARASQRSCVKSFPVQIRELMLWVWGESGPDAFVEAAATTPAITPELEALPEGARVFRIGKPYQRDVTYDFATLIENFLDPAHVPFAHHGVQGNRYKYEPGLPAISPSAPEHTPPNSGFCFDVSLKTFGPTLTTTQVSFQPPCRVRYFTPRDNGAFSVMTLFCVPTGPGRARMTYQLLSTVESKFTKMAEKIPVFLDHQQRNLVLDGDHAMLHAQERVLEAESEQLGSSWRKAYYMPTSSDRIVTAWRQWLDRCGAPTWAPGAPPPPPPQPKPVLLDRFEQHTKHCPHCLKALFWFKAARAAAAVLGLASVVASLTLALTRPLAAQWQLLAVAAAGFAFAWRKASDWVQKFYYENYDHQAKH